MYDLQKASMGKRISAFLFDVIMLFTVAVGLIWAIFAIAGYDGYAEAYDAEKAACISEYEEIYGIELDISKEDAAKLSAEELEVYNKAVAAANEAFGKNEAAAYNYGMMVNIIMLAVSLGALISYLILEFTIPLILKNGQTLGKKIFGVAVMYTSGIRINAIGMFIRTVLGKYTVETMVPAMIVFLIILGRLGIVGTAVLVLLAVFELGLIIFNKTRPLIHDALATTVCVDLGSQLIFADENEMIENKKRIHAEAAEKAKYLD